MEIQESKGWLMDQGLGVKGKRNSGNGSSQPAHYDIRRSLTYH